MRFRRMRKIQDALQSEINKHSEPELRKLISECHRLTQKNCSWIMYVLKEPVIAVAQAQLRWLKTQKDLAKHQSKTDYEKAF